MISIWEQQSFLKYDFVIIGAGIVGLSTAISLKEKNKESSVLILERGVLPSGASTKNAGFACFGTLTEILADIDAIGEDAAVDLVESRWRGLQKLRKRLGDYQIDYQNNGGYELLWQKDLGCLEYLDKVNRLLYPIFSKNVYEENPDLINSFGFNKKKIKTIVSNSFEGQIDSGKMMKSLILLAYSLGISIITGAEVTKFENSGDNDNEICVAVDEKLTATKLNFCCKYLAICTNAFTKKFMPELDIIPGRGIVLATKPIEKLKLQGTYHFNEGYYYFRNFENRIIFGGGRNLDFKKESTDQFEINRNIAQKLRDLLEEIIIPGQEFEVEYLWAGIMAFGQNKIPLIKKINKNMVLGVRLGGMGVAIGTLVGERLAGMVLEN